MTNVVYHNPPTALPLGYSIDPVGASPDLLYRLTWQGIPVDSFYSIGDAVEAGLTHFAFVEDADCASGDMHALADDYVDALSIQMLDCCPGPCFSEAEASGHMMELEARGVYVLPEECSFCLRWHLVPDKTERPFYAEAEASQ